MSHSFFLRRLAYITCFFLFFSPSVIMAQSGGEIAEMETTARMYFDKLAFHNALKIYLKLDSMQPNNAKYLYPIGVCYVNELKNEKAIPYLEKCLETPEKYPRNLDYYAGKAYHLSHRFDDAVIHYEIYKHKLKHSKKNEALFNEIEREIESCKYGKQQVSKPTDIKVINLGSQINSKYADYGPVLSADQQMIIFTSTRPGTTGGRMDESDGRYYEDIYISYRTDTGWTAPAGIGAGINTDGHDASISLSPDGQKLLIYRYQSELLSNNTPGDLYLSRLKGTTWTEATKIPEPINSKSWEPSACFSSDERMLFFTSNREGGYGGTDIYVVKQLPNGDWALPMNMGNKINTPFDEDSPFLHPDGKTLYFSSNGHRTIGGFDIFVSKYEEDSKTWSLPENIGYPINTAHDDIHFSWSADGKRVYFSSVRPEGYGENDIYFADINKDAANVMVVKGVVADSATGKPMEATLKVYDSITNELIGLYNSNSSTGKYIIILTEGRNYSITAEASGYRFSHYTINATTIKDFEEVTQKLLLSPEKTKGKKK